MPELRIDPITGRKVLIAEDRAGRPNDFESAVIVQPPDASACPFCAGHEHQTPSSLLEIPDDRGGWRVRVIPNKYPAVSSGNSAGHQEKRGPLFSSQPAVGAHEIIIESPQHIQEIAELSLDDLANVLLVYRDRLRHWSGDTTVRHVTVFKNVGFAGGASLQHIHSQLVALPFVPEVIATEIRGAEQFYDREGECVFCRLLQEEIEQGERLVCEDGPFAAFCAYAGRQPFETWILPTSHTSHYQQLSDDQALPLARLLQQLVRRLQTQLKPLGYNLILHTSPFGEQPFAEQGVDCYHWHLEIIPRTAQLAGLEWGAGVYVNSLSPERAAKLLREAEL